MWWLGDWWRFGDHVYGERAAQALDSETYAFQTFMNASWVAGQIETSRRREVLSWSHHAEVAALEPKEQDRLLDLAVKENWSRQELRQAVRDHRRSEKASRYVETALKEAGRFGVICADPPWQYEHVVSDSRAIENQYPTMTLEEICEMPVSEVILPDCILFLWAPAPKVTEAVKVLEAWGFVYRTHAVWDKQKIGMGYYFRSQHEDLLVATKGKPLTPHESTRISSILSAPRTRHSEKPLIAYEAIEAMYPGMPKLEMFARGKRAGWEVWGNEAE